MPCSTDPTKNAPAERQLGEGTTTNPNTQNRTGTVTSIMANEHETGTPHAWFAGYTLAERTANRSVYVAPNHNGPGLGKFHFRLLRIPSTNEIRLLQYAGATELEQYEARQAAADFREHGPLPRFAHRLWKRRKLPGIGNRWAFVSPALGYPIDVDTAFEDMVRLQLSEPSMIGTSVEAVRA